MEPAITTHPNNDPGPPLPFEEVAAAWSVTKAAIHLIADVLDATERPDPQEYMHITVKRSDTLDIKMVEALLFANDLLDPLKRIEDETSIEWQGEFRWFTRRSGTVASTTETTMELWTATPMRFYTFDYAGREK